VGPPLMFCCWKLHVRAYAALPRHFERVAGCKLRRVAEFQNLPPVSPFSKLFRHCCRISEFASGSSVSNRASLPDYFPCSSEIFRKYTTQLIAVSEIFSQNFARVPEMAGGLGWILFDVFVTHGSILRYQYYECARDLGFGLWG